MQVGCIRCSGNTDSDCWPRFLAALNIPWKFFCASNSCGLTLNHP